MTCLSQHKDGADILVGYFERTLDEPKLRELESHAASCADCRELLGVWNALEEWKAPAVSPDFDAKLYARIAAEAQAPWWKTILAGAWWKPALPVAACAALAMVMVLRAPDPVAPETKAKVETVNIEQIEESLEDLDLLAPLGPGAEL